MATIKQLKAALGLTKTVDAELLKMLNIIYEALKNNPAFSNPPFDLAVLKEGIDKFAALIIAAQDGSKTAVAAKNKQREVVIKMLRQLGHYVEAASNDDPATFSTSGFTTHSTTRTPPQPLDPAVIEWIDRGPVSGQALVKVRPLEKAISFDVRYAVVGADAKPGPWTTVAITSSKKAIVGNLTPAATYVFQVRALGRLGHTDWSDSTTFICA